MNPYLVKMLAYLPGRLAEAVAAVGETCTVNEIRIREGSALCVTCEGENRLLSPVVTPDEIAYTVDRLCGSSVHAHEDTIREGYISVEGGYRVGVCGMAVHKDGEVSAVRGIKSLNIRIPRDIYGVGGRLLERIRHSRFRLSVLIYSRPGIGKTTLLKDLALTLSKEYMKRVAIIDTRREFRIAEDAGVDLLVGYPKGKGIEIALRTMNPEYIICDEIGNAEEAEAILSVQNAGVPFIASAHAGSAVELWHKPNIRRLLEAGIFDLCVGITRKQGASQYSFAFTEIDEFSRLN
ncbi:MAG: Flp pilus assembly complex ATPase component TadA [Clostridia bacterium]|nr:Flp pilus assembly complex ATPase component TadA [Clostridia bacterium]